MQTKMQSAICSASSSSHLRRWASGPQGHDPESSITTPMPHLYRDLSKLHAWRNLSPHRLFPRHVLHFP
ncbi:MAG: hypothetical protein ACRYGR_00620 [Janthinobacterium lividum]